MENYPDYGVDTFEPKQEIVDSMTKKESIIDANRRILGDPNYKYDKTSIQKPKFNPGDKVVVLDNNKRKFVEGYIVRVVYSYGVNRYSDTCEPTSNLTYDYIDVDGNRDWINNEHAIYVGRNINEIISNLKKTTNE